MANTSKKKETTKKTSPKNENVKIKEAKKESKKITKIGMTFKKFFNNPLPMLITLTLVICLLLFYIVRTYRVDRIMVGEMANKDVNIVNIHLFMNKQMNYFYATNAQYLGDDAKIYGYQIGYFVYDDKGKYHEFCSRSGKFETPQSLADVITEQSGWSIGELTQNNYFFKDIVLQNMDKLHFMVLATTDKDNLSKPDITIDYEVNFTKLSK